MEVQSVFISQIVADVILCLAILFLSLRMGKNSSETKPPAIDQKSLLQFQQLLTESRGDADRLFSTLDESYRKFHDLAMSLKNQEGRLSALVEKINGQTEKFEMAEQARDEHSPEKKYERILKLLEEGLPVEEIAVQTGVTSGEILLIDDLEKTKKRKLQAG